MQRVNIIVIAKIIGTVLATTGLTETGVGIDVIFAALIITIVIYKLTGNLS